MNRTTVGLAVGAGYLLGRTRKMKLALAVGALAAGRRMPRGPGALKELMQQLARNPQLKEAAEQVRGELRGVGRAASSALVERRMSDLADLLHDRTQAVRDRMTEAAGQAVGDQPSGEEEPEEPEGAGEPEASEESEEPEEPEGAEEPEGEAAREEESAESEPADEDAERGEHGPKRTGAPAKGRPRAGEARAGRAGSGPVVAGARARKRAQKPPARGTGQRSAPRRAPAQQAAPRRTDSDDTTRGAASRRAPGGRSGEGRR